MSARDRNRTDQKPFGLTFLAGDVDSVKLNGRVVLVGDDRRLQVAVRPFGNTEVDHLAVDLACPRVRNVRERGRRPTEESNGNSRAGANVHDHSFVRVWYLERLEEESNLNK